MNIRRFFAVLLCAAGAVFFLSGCQSGSHYQAKAAEAARAYLLKNAPELTPEQIYFIRYNDPVLLTAPVLGEGGGGFITHKEKLSSEQLQICVTWGVPRPEKDDERLLYMVCGVSDSRMFSWEPLRLIRRTVTPVRDFEDKAVAQCRKFAVNSLLKSLSPRDLNNIRFSFPWIIHSDFELNFNTTGKMPQEDVEKARTKSEKLWQYSLVWKNSDGTAVVFCGVGEKDMEKWQINFAGPVSGEDLAKHTLATVRTPEQKHAAIAVLPDPGADAETATEEPEEK